MASAPQRLVLALIRGYQLLFSPLFAGSCRFVPSCSHYAMEAVSRFGAIRGIWLAVRRLARCHPLGGGGLDPVPAFAPSELPPSLKLRRAGPPSLKLRRTGRRGKPARHRSSVSRTTL